MAWKASVLVVANRTADSEELMEAVRRRAAAGPCDFLLLVPPAAGDPASRAEARRRLGRALRMMLDAGLDASGQVGEPDPVAAVTEIWDPARFDEVVVSTLPTQTSKWLLVDLPHRIERLTGVAVQHVVATEARPSAAGSPPPAHEHHGVLAPLSTLGWGR